MKRLLCIVSNNPFAGSKVIEQLEAAMVAAVFEFDVSILFIGEGVNCLTQNQKGELLGTRSPGKLIDGLDMYEITKLYACIDAVDVQNILDGIEVIDISKQRVLIQEQDIVLGGPT